MNRTNAICGSLLALWMTVSPKDGWPDSIATGIDASASINSSELMLQVDGIANALRSPAVITAARQAQGGAVFSVYLWSDGGSRVLLPWTRITSPEDAEKAAAILIAATHDYASSGGSVGTLTNTAEALTIAYQLLAQVPHPRGRSVVNVITNGTANSGEANLPGIRRMLLSAGVVINGVALPNTDNVSQWLRDNVTGGRGSFVMSVTQQESFTAALQRKFVQDLSLAQ